MSIVSCGPISASTPRLDQHQTAICEPYICEDFAQCRKPPRLPHQNALVILGSDAIILGVACSKSPPRECPGTYASSLVAVREYFVDT
eukprot:1954151-Pyramimonas_sp.AAC.1